MGRELASSPSSGSGSLVGFLTNNGQERLARGGTGLGVGAVLQPAGWVAAKTVQHTWEHGSTCRRSLGDVDKKYTAMTNDL